MKVLMLYYYTPGTTAWYLERALRKGHEVKTCGPQAKGYKHHDAPLPNGYLKIDIFLKALAKTWKPDFFLMVDSAYSFYPVGVTRLPIPTLFYAIDSQWALYAHSTMARVFDLVFLAQKEFLGYFRKKTHRRIFWLPLACDPQVHKQYRIPKKYDLCFLGNIYSNRAMLLARLSREFNVYQGRVSPEEMTRIYAESKIVLNKSASNDLNMRVFEAPASGSMLLTNRLQNNGLEEIFTDRKDLVLYDTYNVEEIAGYYLTHEEEREAIALRGYQKAVSLHTYDQRAQQIVEEVNKLKGVLPERASPLEETVALKKFWFFQSRFGNWLGRSPLSK